MSKPDTREAGMEVLLAVLTWSRAKDYKGHSKHDALNSPFLERMTFGRRLLRLLYIQAIMRFPFNLRTLFGVPRQRNPKGIGLFAHAWFDLADMLSDDAPALNGWTREACIKEGEQLLAWLVHHASPWTVAVEDLLDAFPREGGRDEAAILLDVARDLKGLGWGYHYPWQDVGFFQQRHFPNRVVSSWIGFAFIRAFEVTGEQRYLDVAREIVRFHFDNPRRLVDTKEQLCLSYVPLDEIEWAVMDVSALVAALTAQVAFHQGDAGLMDDARRLMAFVIDKQTDYGAWYYTWPPDDSHIKHDNYHTGIILDCIADYMSYSGDISYEEAYREGLQYYEQHLFTAEGAPRWMNDRTFPRDVHGAAAGLLAFTRAAKYFAADHDAAVHVADVAERITTWTLRELYSGKGYFYYQKTRWFTKRFCLMRWCNAWMCRALAQRAALRQSP